MTQSYTMTRAETEIYDGGDDIDTSKLLRRLKLVAQGYANDSGKSCEILTADGIVVEVVEVDVGAFTGTSP